MYVLFYFMKKKKKREQVKKQKQKQSHLSGWKMLSILQLFSCPFFLTNYSNLCCFIIYRDYSKTDWSN